MRALFAGFVGTKIPYANVLLLSRFVLAVVNGGQLRDAWRDNLTNLVL